MKVSELKRLISKRGCKFHHQGGDHEIWISPDGNMFPVPRHNSQEVPTGTYKSIMKAAGLK